MEVRDRGAELKYDIYNSVEEAISDVNTEVIVYLYIWDGNTWSVKKRDYERGIWKKDKLLRLNSK